MGTPRPEAARALIHEALGARAFPCAVAAVGTSSALLWTEAAGRLTFEDDAAPATFETVFDLASLTKVIATTSAALAAAQARRLDLDAPLGSVLPAWQGHDRAHVTVTDLLEHAGGLSAHLPLYESCAGSMEYERAICDLPLEYEPRSRAVYSDLGFILLAFALERAEGQPFERLAARLLGTLGLDTALVFRPPPAWKRGIAPTQVNTWRGRLLQGEVDDDNAWALSGIAGHAGLFGSAGAVGRFAQAVLAQVRAAHGLAPRPPAVWADDALWRRAVRKSAVPASSRALGWDTMLPTSSCGTKMTATAIGHTGFTGTSLWIDWERDLYVVLLTNRVHPDASNPSILHFRPAFHDAVMADLADRGTE